MQSNEREGIELNRKRKRDWYRQNRQGVNDNDRTEQRKDEP